MARIIDILPEDEQRKERILHLAKRLEQMRRDWEDLIAELAEEVGRTVK